MVMENLKNKIDRMVTENYQYLQGIGKNITKNDVDELISISYQQIIRMKKHEGLIKADENGKLLAYFIRIMQNQTINQNSQYNNLNPNQNRELNPNDEPLVYVQDTIDEKIEHDIKYNLILTMLVDLLIEDKITTEEYNLFLLYHTTNIAQRPLAIKLKIARNTIARMLNKVKNLLIDSINE